MSVDFSPVDTGLVRHPQNIETIHVRMQSGRPWLEVSRNDVTLKFPLNKDTAAHLSRLLAEASEQAAIILPSEGGAP